MLLKMGFGSLKNGILMLANKIAWQNLEVEHKYADKISNVRPLVHVKYHFIVGYQLSNVY